MSMKIKCDIIRRRLQYNLKEFAGYAASSVRSPYDCPTGRVSSTPGEHESYLFARYSLN